MPNWSDIATIELVDRTALNNAVATGVFTVKSGQSVPTGTQCVTATEAKTWLNLNESYLPAGNQLPTKQQLVAVGVTVTSYAFSCKLKNAAPANSACIFMGISSFTDTVYAAVPTLAVGTTLYANSSLTILLGVNSFIVPGSANYYFVSNAADGKITTIGSCN